MVPGLLRIGQVAACLHSGIVLLRCSFERIIIANKFPLNWPLGLYQRARNDKRKRVGNEGPDVAPVAPFPVVAPGEHGDTGGHAAIGSSPPFMSRAGYQRLKIPANSPFSVRTRVCNNTCAPS